MKKTIIPIILVLAVAVVGYLAYTTVLNKPDSQLEESMIEETTLDDTDSVDSVSGSIFDLVGMNNKMCTYTYEDGEVLSNGSIYAANSEQMYGEIDTVINNETRLMRILYLTDFMYVWDQTTKEGMKVSRESFDPSDFENFEGDATMPDLNYTANYDFDCTNWDVDNSLFNVPSDVNFVDMSAMIETFNSSNSPTGVMNNQDMCGACQSIQDASARADCLAALDC